MIQKQEQIIPVKLPRNLFEKISISYFYVLPICRSSLKKLLLVHLFKFCWKSFCKNSIEECAKIRRHFYSSVLHSVCVYLICTLLFILREIFFYKNLIKNNVHLVNLDNICHKDKLRLKVCIP